MINFLKSWGFFIVFVFVGEAAYSDGSFALSIKKDIKPEIPIVVIEHGITNGNTFLGITPEVAGTMAVIERVMTKHKFVIVGLIDSQWVLFTSADKIEKEANKQIVNGIKKLFGG